MDKFCKTQSWTFSAGAVGSAQLQLDNLKLFSLEPVTAVKHINLCCLLNFTWLYLVFTLNTLCVGPEEKKKV